MNLGSQEYSAHSSDHIDFLSICIMHIIRFMATCFGIVNAYVTLYELIPRGKGQRDY